MVSILKTLIPTNSFTEKFMPSNSLKGKFLDKFFEDSINTVSNVGSIIRGLIREDKVGENGELILQTCMCLVLTKNYITKKEGKNNYLIPEGLNGLINDVARHLKHDLNKNPIFMGGNYPNAVLQAQKFVNNFSNNKIEDHEDFLRNWKNVTNGVLATIQNNYEKQIKLQEQRQK